MFYGLTAIDLRKIVYEYAQRNNIPHRFNNDKKMAGKDWLQSFLQRHPRLSLRKPESTSLGRISGFNAESVGHFYKNLDAILTKYNFAPNRIFNVDETGITTVQSQSKIVGPKGVKQLGKAVSWERGRNITMCCAVSASGIYIPPMFIYPRTRMSDQLKRNGPVGAIYECSKKGWMNEDLFLSWLKHFQRHAMTSKENPALLVLDNHCSHCSLIAYDFCRENGIIMLSFPPHTSHRLQPLDLTIFGPLKSAYSSECAIFMRQNVHQKITPYDVAEIFNRAFVRVATIEKAQKGFEVSGIVPFRPNIFTEEDFLPSTISRPTAVEIDDSQPDTGPILSGSDVTPSTSTPKTCLKQNKLELDVSIEEITPLRLPANKNSKKRAVRQGSSKILTATPEKTQLLQKEERKSKNKKKQKVSVAVKRATRKIRCDDSSSTASSFNEKELCNDHSSDDPQSEADDEVCFICGEFGKTETWYRCGICKKWAHKECTGFDNYRTYICDYCT